MPTVKKYRQCGIEPKFKEKLDIKFKRVVATGKHAFNPSKFGFAGIPDELSHEHVITNEEGSSINQKEMEESSSLSKRLMLCKRKKDKDIFVKSSFDQLIVAFVAPPHAAPPDSTIIDCIGTLDVIPEAVVDMRFYAKCVKKLVDQTCRQMFMALRPELRIEYLRVLIEE